MPASIPPGQSKRADDARQRAGSGVRWQRRTALAILAAAAAGAVAVAVLIVLNSREGDDLTVDAGNGLRAPASEIDGGLERDGRTLGEQAAPILVVEYADYQCPHCTRFGLTDMPDIVDEYVASGRVRLEYRHLVVIGGDDPDGESYRAAEAAECARDQGRFWELHELLVANSLGEFRGSYTPERLKAIGALVDGLDQAAFAGCVDARTHQVEVAQASAEARAAGIGSTPTFLVNGQVLSGGAAKLDEVIDEQLAGS